jgi:hypothetical protein
MGSLPAASPATESPGASDPAISALDAPWAASAETTSWIIGGGCYGAGYVRQFRKARARGKLPPGRWVVLDRDPDCPAARERLPDDPLEVHIGEWRDLLITMMSAELKPGDRIIPSPFQGTLIADWLTEEARLVGRRLEPVELPEMGAGLRYEQAVGEHQRFVSFAGWTCPVHCIEPPKCPAIRSAKAWDLRDTARDYGAREGFSTVLSFACLHWLYGVGAVPACAFLEARAHVREGPAGRLLLASLSTCHGAFSGFLLTPG